MYLKSGVIPLRLENQCSSVGLIVTESLPSKLSVRGLLNCKYSNKQANINYSMYSFKDIQKNYEVYDTV